MIGAIVQARVGSQRFPGKILKTVGGKALLEYEIERIKKSKLVKRIVLATTVKSEDDVLEIISKKVEVNFFRGHVDNVLDRYYHAAVKFNIDPIVRVTGDCPLIDNKVIDKTIKLFLSKNVEYASNVDPPTFPDGMDVEVFSFRSLKSAWLKAKLFSEKEHVTPYIKKHLSQNMKANLIYNFDYSKLRLTLDYERDLVTIRKVYRSLHLKNNYFGLEDIIELYIKNPKIFASNVKINRNIGYKKSLKGDKKWLQ